MSYIEQVIEYIKTHASQLDIQKHQLGSVFNVSDSKLQKDFKTETGITVRKKIIECKLIKSQQIKAEEPEIYLVALLERIGWTHSPRAFMRACKKQHQKGFFFNNDKNADGGFGTDIDPYLTFMRNSELLDLLLFRFVLATEKYTIRHNSIGHKMYTVQIKKSILQSAILPLDKALIFDLWLDIEDPKKIQINMFLERYGEENFMYGINSLGPYLFMIGNISSQYLSQPALNIRKAIQNWQVIYDEQERIDASYLTSLLSALQTPETTAIVLDLNSSFIKSTQKHLDKISDSFTNDMDEQLKRHMGFDLASLLKFLRLARSKMNSELNLCTKQMLQDKVLSIARRQQRLDLLLSIIEVPYLEFLDLRDYTFHFDQQLIKQILKVVSHENLPDFLIKFGQQIALRAKDENDINENEVWEEKNENDKLLTDVLNMYLSKSG